VPARDQHLPLPPLPAANDLSLASDWLAANKRLLELTAQYRSANDELIGLLTENLRKAERNQHGLEVFLTIANLCRENLDMIDSFSLIAGRFNAAQGSAANKKAEAAVAQLDRALDAVQQIRRDRNRVFRETTAVWAKSWHLRTPEANGRRFVHELDDVKDHLPDRTPDMSYLIYRELQLPVQSWFEQMLAVRNRYAGAHALPARSMQLRWTETTN
jgi:hypothetical protein